MDTDSSKDNLEKVPPVPVFERRGHRETGFIKNRLEKCRKNFRDFLLDHPKTKFTVEQIYILIIEAVSGFIFAYGFKAFMSPTTAPDGGQATHLVSGGASGISQVLTRICEILFGTTLAQESLLQSIFYFVVNIPILTLSFLKIGKRFTFYSLVNVGMASLFIYIIPDSWYTLIDIYSDNIARALAGGITTGIASGMALAIGTSSGGVDILSIYIAEKKSTSMGKYSLIINLVTVLAFTALNFVHAPSVDSSSTSQFEQGSTQATMALYSIIYFYLSAKIIDWMNIKNKKTELQIMTSKPEMAQVLIHGFPHACTILDAKGGFTGASMKVIYIVVSKSEEKKVVKIVRQVDPHSFVSVLSTEQVYGKFYIKPLD